MLTPSGIHHVTAIASDPQRTLDFYAGVLGLRLVKRTVNFDDPTTYHFYFGDEAGSPGTILTFFPWPGARRGRQGAGQAAVVSLAITPGSVGYWLDRLVRQHIDFEQPVTRLEGERVIAFKDPDGLLLELVAHPDTVARPPGYGGGPVDAEHAVRGIYGVTLWLEAHQRTAELLTTHLGFELVREQGSIYRYAVRGAEPGMYGALLDLRVVPGLWEGGAGAGTIHHIAFRAVSEPAQLQLRATLAAEGMELTPQLDRDYFRSIYFREPGGVLFEIATDAPGFATDEPADRLGRTLRLPAWLEPRRFEIEALLPNIHLPIDLPGPNQ
jgi:glyoxalase family protein